MPNRKKLYKDMDKFRRTTKKQRERYYKKSQNAPNSRMRWTDEEIDIVMAHKIPDREISKQLGRSVGAIQVCRTKHR